MAQVVGDGNGDDDADCDADGVAVGPAPVAVAAPHPAKMIATAPTTNRSQFIPTDTTQAAKN
jgi:hypothetical protein